MATQLGGGGTPVSAAQAESKQPQSGAERLLKMLHRNIGTLQRNVTTSMERLEILHNQLDTLQGGAGAADDSEQRNIESEIEKESDMLSKRLERIDQTQRDIAKQERLLEYQHQQQDMLLLILKMC